MLMMMMTMMFNSFACIFLLIRIPYFTPSLQVSDYIFLFLQICITGVGGLVVTRSRKVRNKISQLLCNLKKYIKPNMNSK